MSEYRFELQDGEVTLYTVRPNRAPPDWQETQVDDPVAVQGVVDAALQYGLQAAQGKVGYQVSNGEPLYSMTLTKVG